MLLGQSVVLNHTGSTGLNTKSKKIDEKRVE